MDWKWRRLEKDRRWTDGGLEVDSTRIRGGVEDTDRTLGWGIYRVHNDLSINGGDEIAEMASDVPTCQIMHYCAHLLREPQFKIFGQLTNEYAIDMFT